MKAPCMDCSARVLGCHQSCERYQEFKRKWELVRAERFKAHQRMDEFIGVLSKKHRRDKR